MSSIVSELQRQALDPAVAVADLLRRALVVARKLKLREIDAWIANELDGYGQGSTVPPYRRLRGQVRVYNPYHGWQTMTFENSEHADEFTKRFCGTPVSALEHLLENPKDGAFLTMPFTAEAEVALMKSMEVALRPEFHVSRSTVASIVDTVRNSVLKWALQLEADGVLGDGLSFTSEEEAHARAGSYQITNYYGPITNSQFAAGAQNPVQTLVSTGLRMDDIRAILAQVRELAGKISLDETTSAELSAELATVDVQLASPKPKSAIITQSLLSVRTILEGAGGNVVGTLLVELGKLLVS